MGTEQPPKAGDSGPSDLNHVFNQHSLGTWGDQGDVAVKKEDITLVEMRLCSVHIIFMAV